MRQSKTALWIALGILLPPIILLITVHPIAQPLWYHDFADQRTFFGIPHFYNVVSNLPFVAFGLWGLWYVARCPTEERFQGRLDRWLYGMFFAFVFLTGIGSVYYHAHPDNDRLLWDRLPLALAFMALFALILAERVSYSLGIMLFLPLLFLGAGSVSEGWGQGDLRPYFLVQLYPLVVIPVLLILFPARFTLTQDLYAALVCYLLAKALEILDRQVYSQGQIISGHTLKHLVASLAPLFILHMIRGRRFAGHIGTAPTINS
jgi:hypothetical protein